MRIRKIVPVPISNNVTKSGSFLVYLVGHLVLLLVIVSSDVYALPALSGGAVKTLLNLKDTGYSYKVISGTVYSTTPSLCKKLPPSQQCSAEIANAPVESVTQTLILVGSSSSKLKAEIDLPKIDLNPDHFKLSAKVKSHLMKIKKWLHDRPVPATYRAYVDLVWAIQSANYRDLNNGVYAGLIPVQLFKEKFLHENFHPELVVVVPKELLANLQDYMFHPWHLADAGWDLESGNINTHVFVRQMGELNGYQTLWTYNPKNKAFDSNQGELETYPEIYRTSTIVRGLPAMTTSFDPAAPRSTLE